MRDTRAVLIDLGDNPGQSPLPYPPSPRGAWVRRVAVAATVGLLLAVSAAAPSTGGFKPSWTSAGGGIVVVGDLVVVYPPSGGLTARSLDHGSVRWTKHEVKPNAVRGRPA